MRPAASVLLLTTLIGAGQGLFLALAVLAELAAPADAGLRTLLVAGSAASLALLVLGLAASFFHLGRPERAWRAAAMWRTSWLSREVIALPLFMGLVAAWGASHWLDAPAAWSRGLAALGALACIALFVCTAMIYACLRFLQEWHSPLTVANFMLLGIASGLTLATALAHALAPAFAGDLARAAIAATLFAALSRLASLARNARLRPKSTPQTAIGVKHPRIEQKSLGAMGGTFNTREFFHGASRGKLRAIKWGFLLGAFALPLPLLAAGWAAAAFVVQMLGLYAERWYFFAQANHPQNIYYRQIS
ncbi:MAG: dimethyl sulfoxide reductase anchor subunit family protein [Burkholderiales bacterium]